MKPDHAAAKKWATYDHPNELEGEANIAAAYLDAMEKLEIARTALENLIAVKGRYHTEQAYRRCEEALTKIGESK